MSANEVIEILSDSEDDELECISETRHIPQGNRRQPIDLDLEEDDDLQVIREERLQEETRGPTQREPSPHHINIFVPGSGMVPFDRGRQRTPNSVAASFAGVPSPQQQQHETPALTANARTRNNRSLMVHSIRSEPQLVHINRRHFHPQRRSNGLGFFRRIEALRHAFPLFTPDDDFNNDFVDGMGERPNPLVLLNAAMADHLSNRVRVDMDRDIMAIIERRDNADFDTRSKKNQQATQTFQQKVQDAAEKTTAPYTSTIDEAEEYICVLCGVTLGMGIPDEFKGDRGSSVLAQLQERFEVTAPYQATKLVTEVDKDLSKRTFFAGCGHTYCGRCVKNIANAKALTKAQKLKIKKSDIVIENPYVYAPAKCTEQECKQSLRGKTCFQEAFL